MGWLSTLLLAAVIYYFLSRVFSSDTAHRAQPQSIKRPARDAVSLQKPPAQELIGNIQGPGLFEFEIVGESHYQDALESIAGPKDEDSKQLECTAELVLDDDNKYDNQAVLVAIEGQKVGHLSRQHAREFRAELKRQNITVGVFKVPALIVGGWDRGDDDVGHFGVKLDLPLNH